MALLSSFPFALPSIKPYRSHSPLLFSTPPNPSLPRRPFRRRLRRPVVSSDGGNGASAAITSEEPRAEPKERKASVPTFQQAIQRLQKTHALIVLRYGGYWRWIPRTSRIKYECGKHKTFRIVLEYVHFTDLLSDILNALPKYEGDHLKLSFAVPGTEPKKFYRVVSDPDFMSMLEICRDCWKIFMYMTTVKKPRRGQKYFISRRSSRELNQLVELRQPEELCVSDDDDAGPSRFSEQMYQTPKQSPKKVTDVTPPRRSPRFSQRKDQSPAGRGRERGRGRGRRVPLRGRGCSTISTAPY